MARKARKRRTSISRRVALIVLGVVGFYSLMDQLVDRGTMLPSFAALERDEARKDINRCVKALEREVDYLRVFAADWAAWDDTYEFVEDHNEDYIDANLPLSTFEDGRLNVIAFFDSEGELAWGRAYDPEFEVQIPLDELLSIPLKPHASKDGLDDGLGRAGILLTKHGPMVAACMTILTSENEGPARGVMVMGRFVGDQMLDELRQQTQVDFTITPVSGMAEDELEILSEIKRSDGVYMVEASGTQLSAYAEMPGLDGNPALVLNAHLPRTITSRGRETVLSTLVSTLGAGLVVLLVLMVTLRRVVVVPLSELARRITSITNTGGLSARIHSDRTDEIGVLADEFDRLLAHLEEEGEERERVDAALRESEERYRSFVTDFPGIAFRGRMDFTPIFFRGAVEEITGFTEADFLRGQPRWIEIVHPKDVESVRESGGRIRNIPGYSEQREYRIIHKSGQVRWIHELIKNICDESGEATFVQAALYDITELKEMRERVERSDRLVAIGEMGASIAHEIRNPLTGISSAIQVIGRSISDDDPRKPVFQEVLAQVDRLDDTVRGLLMFARPWTPEKENCDAEELLRQACEESRSHEAFRSVELLREAEPGLLVQADPALCRQVVRNLMRNAAQAMPDGGRISLTARRQGQVARIVVADTGEGMTPDVLEQVFRPFFTTKTQGTGLGLAICRQIVEAHAGTLTIESAPGEGTQVTIELPLE